MRWPRRSPRLWAEVTHALLERHVCTDYRGDGLRVSPHFFNTEDEIDHCFDELRTLV
jgi:selenocysteine lyase/cysteine desulfurase